MKNSIDLFSEMMRKSKNTQPEPIVVNVSPDAKGMDPELFGGLADGLQEVKDIDNGKIDASDYMIENLDTELYWGKAQGSELQWQGEVK